MNNDDVMRAAARLEHLKSRAERYLVYGFGTGPYGLMGVFDDGTQRLKAYGFDTVEDAKLFRLFADESKPDSPAAMQAVMDRLGYANGPSAKWLRFDVVRISVVTDDLQVPRG